MGKILGVVSTVLILWIPQGGWSTTWYVDASVSESGDGTSWETAFQTIQEGIEAAYHGHTVIVAQGTYVENIRFEERNITLRSTGPLDPAVVGTTIIDGNRDGPVVTFSGAQHYTCVLSGFTIRNGRAFAGGGICGGTRGVPTQATIRNNVIISNSADDHGGGLAYCNGTIENNTVSGNSARWWGGGLAYCHGTIQDNFITGNSAEWGGGLYWCDGTIQSNTISGNSSASDGGGLAYCDGSIQNNTIANNSAEDDGGGLARCNGVIQNNLTTGNSAQWRGGGLYWCDGTIQNNTITANSAESEGGGLYGCEGAIRNCIIWGNTAPREPHLCASSDPTYSCIQDWPSGGTDNITDAPLFLNAAQDDFHLQPESPCIDAGVNDYWFAWPQSDLEGNCRLVGSRTDMGCYEYGSSPDGDGDLFADADEEAAGTDPESDDSDGDGLRDGLEILRGSDPVAPTPPRVVHVPSDIPTIRKALLFAVTGEEIIVAPGTYRDNLHFSGVDVTLRSTSPQDSDTVASTVLDGGGVGPAVSLTGSETEACVLSGFTIRDGKASDGGGICGGVGDIRTHATIRNNTIASNSADDDGGGVAYCDGMIQNNTITGNSAGRWGGGLAFCSGVVENNLLTGNTADDAGGGLAYCDGIIQNNVITGNRALGKDGMGQGGGLYACGGTIQLNTINGNWAFGEQNEGEGGGLADCGGTIQLNIITSNSADDYGGGLCRCDGTVKNNAVTGNSANEGGGFAYCDAAIQNNTITGNRASKGGGLAYCNGAIQNCVIWGNPSDDGLQIAESSEPTYSCIQDWTGGGDGNIADDPLFVDPDGADDNPETQDDNDYRLRPDSRCIDAGDNSVLDPPGLDLDRNLRVAFGRASITLDMGAYEYNSAPFAVSLIIMDDVGLLLVWNSQPGETYRVCCCADMAAGQWVQEAAAIPCEGSFTWWADLDTTSTCEFYRVEVE